MTKIFRMPTFVAALALGLSATPALAVAPNQNSTATARITKPLTLTYVRDLNLGTIVLSGSGVWTGASIGISRVGAFTCANGNVTCSGATQTAQYKITGTNNQTVTVNHPM